ncbi:hypothetical protein CJ030_MR1G027830 [Morella rubra]|uniref:F-box/kelch-repeat protein SKIP11 n=1 Tax=Morella rubra TaxID=262757 RepID=A0A6A1WKI9_9ROSI|nr:hypothetical protein CJ030_MR1G027830 [Morella rubra]
MGSVCKSWRSFIQSKELITVRKLAGVLEEWLYVLTMDAKGKESHWEVLDCLGHKHRRLPLMPGPVKAGFGVVVLNGKLLVMAGFSVIDGPGSASPDVYQYDSCLNSWSKLAKMNVARYEFACAEVNGKVYAVGGYGVDGDGLSCVENGCVMVTAHAMLGERLFCMEWKNQRKLAIFTPEDNSWKMVPVPLTGSSCIGFRFGILDGKLLLFSLQQEPGYPTLLYDPNASPGSEWRTSDIKPSGLCLCSVTIKA